MTRVNIFEGKTSELIYPKEMFAFDGSTVGLSL